MGGTPAQFLGGSLRWIDQDVLWQRGRTAVGVSLGIERIFMLMEEMGLMPDTQTNTQVWATVFSSETRSSTLKAAAVLRQAGMRVQVSTRTGKPETVQRRIVTRRAVCTGVWPR